MGARTSQLQIRVTPAEKTTLKRLAAAAGETVSSYVLSKVLPSLGVELVTVMRRLGDRDVDVSGTFVELAEALDEIPADELAEAVPEPDADTVAPIVLNRVAALVEAEATRRAAVAPAWTRRVPPLTRPHFGWFLTSLKPHQMRVTPAAFKRRNLFFDPATAPAPAFTRLDMKVRPEPGARSWAARELSLFAMLDTQLASEDLEIEFYFLGGALLMQAFSAAPATAHVSAMFQPVSAAQAAIRDVARAEAADEGWPYECARALLQGAGEGEGLTYLELPRVRVFEPRPEYLLAVKCGAMNLGDAFAEMDDVRYVLRGMNIGSADVALALVARYLTERQLPPDIRARLEALLPS